MQIFSKLQRNSLNYIIIIFAIIWVNIFNSSFLYFPLMIGAFFYCSEFFIGVVFLIFFAILHGYNPIIFFIFFLFYKIYFRYLRRVIHQDYFDVVSIFIVYIFLIIYLLSFSFNFTLAYILYNFSIDILIIRLLKCKAKFFYL